MAKKQTPIPPKLQPWPAARTKYRLTHARVQDAQRRMEEVRQAAVQTKARGANSTQKRQGAGKG